MNAHDLRTMLADLVALQALATAGSLRSVHRDPREEAGRTTGGRKLPELSPVEAAYASGDLTRARRTSAILARVPRQHHEVLLWLADRAHGAPGLPWPWVLAQSLAPPPMRDAVLATEEAHRAARAVREQLRAALSRGSKRVTAEALRTAEQVHAAHAKADAEEQRTKGAHDAAQRKLMAWGDATLESAVAAWMRARGEVTGDAMVAEGSM